VNSFCNECHQQQPFLFCPLRKYGPFRPQIQVSVPLWLASILKKQGRCIIVAPKWLSISSLRTVLESERTDDVFQALPFHYVEVATDLCKYAREDMEDWSLIYDLTVTTSVLNPMFAN
jgi:GINS complex subunit 2